jgi:mono/diheme cytochrome c family protein
MSRKVANNWGKMLFLAIAVLIAAGAQTVGAAQSTADLYAEKCAACHGDTGKGDGPAGAAMTPPPVPFSTALKGKSDSWIGTVITKGGPAVGMTPAMPPHPTLSSHQVTALIQYIKGLKS